MRDAIGGYGAGTKALQIVKRTAMHICSGGGECGRRRIGPGQTGHRMSGIDEFTHNCRADKAAGMVTNTRMLSS